MYLERGVSFITYYPPLTHTHTHTPPLTHSHTHTLHPSHTQSPKPILSRIVIVSNIPRGPAIPKIKNRLDQLSDNCGGKVLKVDPDRGNARILYRTNDWAVK